VKSTLPSPAALVVGQYAARRGTEILLDPQSEPLDALRRHFACLRDDLAKAGYALGCLLGVLPGEARNVPPTCHRPRRRLEQCRCPTRYGR
jgi:hypothetical protein